MRVSYTEVARASENLTVALSDSPKINSSSPHRTRKQTAEAISNTAPFAPSSRRLKYRVLVRGKTSLRPSLIQRSVARTAVHRRGAQQSHRTLPLALSLNADLISVVIAYRLRLDDYVCVRHWISSCIYVMILNEKAGPAGMLCSQETAYIPQICLRRSLLRNPSSACPQAVSRHRANAQFSQLLICFETPSQTILSLHAGHPTWNDVVSIVRLQIRHLSLWARCFAR